MAAVLLLLVVCIVSFTAGSEDEFRLIQDLRTNYDSVERPVDNHTLAVLVNMRIILQQIVDVDEKNQVLTLVVWQQSKWQDYKMRWDPTEYGGIKMLQLPNSFLWKPDILLFNSADENFDASFAVNFVVQHTGEVLLAPPGIVKLSCPIDITWFPYDEQVCHLKYGSWTYNGNQLDLRIDDDGLEEPHHMDLQYYMPNGEWELLATPAERVATEFAGEKFVEVYFRVHIKRRTLYYGLNWIVPSVLISLTNVLGFTLQPECGEKITLQITNLLSVTVFLGMVSEITPPTSESIPVIALFFSISILLLGCSIVVTILIVNVFYRSPDTHEMSDWMRVLFLEWLPWLLLMKRPGTKFTRPYSDRSSTSTASSDLSSAPGTEKIGRRMAITIESVENAEKVRRLLPEESAMRLARHDSRESFRRGLFRSSSIESEETMVAARLEAVVKECAELLKEFKEKLDEDDRSSDAQADWRFVAMVLDRISLYLFTGLFIVMVIFLVCATPRIFDYAPFNVTAPELADAVVADESTVLF